MSADSVISSIRKQYVDTRTQANLKKLNANSGQELNIIVESLSTVVKNRKQLGKISVSYIYYYSTEK